MYVYACMHECTCMYACMREYIYKTENYGVEMFYTNNSSTAYVVMHELIT